MKCYRLMYKVGAIFSMQGAIALFKSISKNDFEAVKFLVENGVPIDSKIISQPELSHRIPGYVHKDNSATTFLHVAVLACQNPRDQLERQIVRKYPIGQEIQSRLIPISPDHRIPAYLIEKGAQMRIEDAYGKTPFRLAVLRNDFPLVMFMLQKDPSILLHTGFDNQSALLDAIEEQNLEMVKLLLRHASRAQSIGDLLEIQNGHGYTAISLAKSMKALSVASIEIVNFLSIFPLDTATNTEAGVFPLLRFIMLSRSKERFELWLETLNPPFSADRVHLLESTIDSFVIDCPNDVDFKVFMMEQLASKLGFIPV